MTAITFCEDVIIFGVSAPMSGSSAAWTDEFMHTRLFRHIKSFEKFDDGVELVIVEVSDIIHCP